PSLLALALLSAMTAVSGFGLSKLYLSDAGWALQDIGRLGMSGGLVTVFLGCGGGAWLVRRIGLWRGFALGVVLAGCSALLWYLQAGRWLALSEGLAWTCVLIGSLATGITSVAILTAAMRFAGQGGQAGTDVTAVQSTRDLGEMLASSFLVSLTAQIGYAGGFLTGSALAVLALLLALRLQAGEGRGE
ncbi:MFS transporter, partial [Pseudomonas aeruginosa]|nr:MFS transporter [Pseudomonas aeruginosa]